MGKIEEPDFKEIFSSIEIIPLQTDSSLVGKFFASKRGIYVPNKYYVAIDSRYVIHVFDLHGNFIANSSQHIGQGPQEYFILQDVIYNQFNNTFDILDPFGNIFSFSPKFEFVSKIHIEAKTKDRFRKLYAIDKSQYLLFDDMKKGSFIIYDCNKKKVKKEIKYPGLIAGISSNSTPFNCYNNTFYFIPPEINNYIFTYDKEDEKLIPCLFTTGDKHIISKSDIQGFNSTKEISNHIMMSSSKYSPIDRLYNGKYLITTYLKQQKTYFNIYNMSTQKNKTFKREEGLKLNLPIFLSLENDVVYAIIYPQYIKEQVDKDLLINKDVLKSIKEDDNPCFVKYKLKL